MKKALLKQIPLIISNQSVTLIPFLQDLTELIDSAFIYEEETMLDKLSSITALFEITSQLEEQQQEEFIERILDMLEAFFDEESSKYFQFKLPFIGQVTAILTPIMYGLLKLYRVSGSQ